MSPVICHGPLPKGLRIRTDTWPKVADATGQRIRTVRTEYLIVSPLVDSVSLRRASLRNHPICWRFEAFAILLKIGYAADFQTTKVLQPFE